jgi:hypothetical protein
MKLRKAAEKLEDAIHGSLWDEAGKLSHDEQVAFAMIVLDLRYIVSHLEKVRHYETLPAPWTIVLDLLRAMLNSADVSLSPKARVAGRELWERYRNGEQRIEAYPTILKCPTHESCTRAAGHKGPCVNHDGVMFDGARRKMLELSLSGDDNGDHVGPGKP